jgi:uracil-DNA glycosylase family 4
VPADPPPNSLHDQLRFFRDLGVTDLFLEAPRGVPALIPGSMPDLPSLQKFLAGCPRCKLSKGRTHIVFGQGNPKADLMFVGEAPGRDEDEQGLAFVGRAGQLLTKIIEAIGKKREDVFIANVLKCRPPNNRNPEPDEVASCRPFLDEQIRLISPRVIVTLGTFAAQALLETDEPIGRMRGRWRTARGVRVMPTFHPAFLLRSPERKKDVWEDMKLVRDFLAEK